MCIIHVMDLIKDHPLQINESLRSPIEHGPQDLRGHDQTRGLRRYLDIARDQTNVVKSRLELAELLIGQSLDRRCVNDPNTNIYTCIIIIKLSDSIKSVTYSFDYFVLCLNERAMAYSATTVLPADVCAATKTHSEFSIR